MPKLLFVTVGTTNFDNLTTKICEKPVIDRLTSLGFTHVRIQIGSGKYIPTLPAACASALHLSWYRYKDTITDDINDADLIVSHAGAGTCLEVLQARKPLIVVVNETLMHNHQLELALELSNHGYLYYTTCAHVEHVLNSDLTKLKTYTPGNLHAFVKRLNEIVGF